MNPEPPAPDPGRCPGCPHKAHRDQCPSKGPSRCGPVLDPASGQQAGIVTGANRLPCTCPYGWCHDCGALIAGAHQYGYTAALEWTLALLDPIPAVPAEPEGD